MELAAGRDPITDADSLRDQRDAYLLKTLRLQAAVALQAKLLDGLQLITRLQEGVRYTTAGLLADLTSIADGA